MEVKPRAHFEAIRLSASEWKKARRFSENFWLYIVTEAASAALRLHCIQNPTPHLHSHQHIQTTRR